MPEYAIILLLLFLASFFLHKFYKLKLFKSKKHLIYFYTIGLAIGTIWDQFAIARGHWSFGNEFLLGPHVGLMPIEEYGFAFITSYFMLVIYKLVEEKF